MIVAAVLVAAGSGSRLAAGVPKAFVEVSERTLLEHAAERFLSSRALRDVVVVVPAEWTDRARELLGRAPSEPVPPPPVPPTACGAASGRHRQLAPPISTSRQYPGSRQASGRTHCRAVRVGQQRQRVPRGRSRSGAVPSHRGRVRRRSARPCASFGRTAKSLILARERGLMLKVPIGQYSCGAPHV